MASRGARFPELVVRPSGIWDSRAPFHNYLIAHREQSRSYYIACLALNETQRLTTRQLRSDDYGRNLFKARKTKATAGLSWLRYTKSFGRRPNDARHRPSVAEISADLENALHNLREAAIIRCVSLFETFAQCWSLNLLLTRVETGQGWTSSEAALAASFHPEYGEHDPPGWPRISKSIPNLASGLRELPHINTDPSTGAEVRVPVSPELNAFQTIRFWRGFRNVAIHNSDIISAAFAREYGPFFDKVRAFAPHIPPLQAGKHLLFYDDLYRATKTVHYKAALWMNEWLETESTGRRGHLWAPGPKPTTLVEGEPMAPPMLIAGDHCESYLWVTDPNFRSKIRSALHRGT